VGIRVMLFVAALYAAWLLVCIAVKCILLLALVVVLVAAAKLWLGRRHA